MKQAPRRAIATIVGPTASGKSALAMQLAERFPTVEIVSADSRQVYLGLDVGTAKPTLRERELVRHHLIDIVPASVNYTAGDYALDARSAIADIIDRGRLPLVVGGSGFYIRALYEGLSAPTVDQSIYSEVEELARVHGYQHVYDELLRVDPVAATAQSANNRVKVFRALACYRQTGRPYSSFVGAEAISDAAIQPSMLGLAPPRQELYDRIDHRVLEMLGSGLLEETRQMIAMGFDRESPGLRTVGYVQALKHLAGELSYDAMVSDIQQSTRRYAKRQMTWFRNVRDVLWLERPTIEVAADWLEQLA